MPSACGCDPAVALNTLITIRQRAPGTDAAGQPVDTWQTVATPWAEIRYPSGLEQLRGGAQTSVVQASIKVRRNSVITPAMQAVQGARVFNIKAVLPDEVDRLFMFLVCELAQ